MPIPSAQLSDDECSFDDENDETDDTELNIYFHMMAVKLTRKKYFLIVKRLMAMKKSTLNRLILILLLINKSPGLILNNPTGLSLIIKYNFNWEKAEIEKWYRTDNLYFTPELYELNFEQTSTCKTLKELNKSIKSKII